MLLQGLLDPYCLLHLSSHWVSVFGEDFKPEVLPGVWGVFSLVHLPEVFDHPGRILTFFPMFWSLDQLLWVQSLYPFTILVMLLGPVVCGP